MGNLAGYGLYKLGGSGGGGAANTIYNADDTIGSGRIATLTTTIQFKTPNTAGSGLLVGYDGGYGNIYLKPAKPADGSYHRVLAGSRTVWTCYTAGNNYGFGNESASDNNFVFNNNSTPHPAQTETFKIVGGSTHTATLYVIGGGATNATTSFLIENSSATELVKVNDDGSQVHDIGNSQFLIDGDTSGGTSSSFRVNTNGEVLGFKTFFQIDDEGLVEIRGSNSGNGALKVYEDRSTNVTFNIKRQGDGYWLGRSGGEIIIGQATGARAEFDNNWTSFKTSASLEIHRLRVQGGNTTSWLNATGINASNQLIIGATAVAGNESFSVFGATRITSTETDAPALEVDSQTQGFLLPRMTGAEVEDISSPATGLQAYATSAGAGDVTTAGWWGYDGTNWVQGFSGGGSANTIYNADDSVTAATNRLVTIPASSTLRFGGSYVAVGDAMGITSRFGVVHNTGMEIKSPSGGYGNSKIVPYSPSGVAPYNVYHRWHSSTGTQVGLGVVAGCILLDGGGAVATKVSIGTTTHSETLRVKGFGSTSATSSFLVENSSGTASLRISDDGSVYNRGGGDATFSTAFGGEALVAQNSGSRFNTAFGTYAGKSLTTGIHNIAIGYNPLPIATFDTYNIAIGNSSMLVATGGASQNTAIGDKTMASLTFGDRNVAVGANAGASQTSGTDAVSVGYAADGAGTYSIAIGSQAQTSITKAIMLNSSGAVRDNTVTESFAVNVGSATNVLFLGDTADSYFGGTGGFGYGTTTPDASASVDITSTTKGFLPPRMTTVQMNAISSPATGLMVYDTTTNQWMGYNGTAWVILG